MKTIYRPGLCLVIILQCYCLQAQNLPEFTRVQPEKAKLFSKIPSKFLLHTAVLDKLFFFKMNNKVVLPLDKDHFLEGTIIEKVIRNEQVTTLNIMASNFDGALFTLSRIAKPGQAVTYVGRLVSKNYGDAFMMTMQGNEVLFSKNKQALLLAE